MNNLNDQAKEKAITANRDERGATMVEYAIMVALIAVVSIAAISLLGTNINSAFQKVANEVKAVN
jgi:pilus assembly protein Flp/PilA